MNNIPSETIETFARSIFREAMHYGFTRLDLIRLINVLMDLSAKNGDELGDSSRRRNLAEAQVSGIGDFKALPVQSDRIQIRSFDPRQDMEMLRGWLSDEYGRHFMLSSSTAQPISIDTLIQSPTNHLGLITLPDGTPIGGMAFLDHNIEQRRAELRKLIGVRAFRGQGLAEEATGLWIRYGADGLGIEKIYLSTLQTHIRNIKLNEELGFEVEGLLRNEVRFDGCRHDVLRMGISVSKAETRKK